MSPTCLLIAIPVLLGSVGPLPAGTPADRFGGRRVFAALLVISAVPAVGVGFTSKWFSAESQGSALGVYWMGNIGQSVAVSGAPVLVA